MFFFNRIFVNHLQLKLCQAPPLPFHSFAYKILNLKNEIRNLTCCVCCKRTLLKTLVISMFT